MKPLNTNETYCAFRRNPLITPLCRPHLRGHTTAHPQPRFWLPSTSTSPITAPSRCRSDGPLASDAQYLRNMIGWHEAAVEGNRKHRHRVRLGNRDGFWAPLYSTTGNQSLNILEDTNPRTRTRRIYRRALNHIDVVTTTTSDDLVLKQESNRREVENLPWGGIYVQNIHGGGSFLGRATQGVWGHTSNTTFPRALSVRVRVIRALASVSTLRPQCM